MTWVIDASRGEEMQVWVVQHERSPPPPAPRACPGPLLLTHTRPTVLVSFLTTPLIMLRQFHETDEYSSRSGNHCRNRRKL